MRKWNSILSALIMILFLVHSIIGGLQLIGTVPGGLLLPKLLDRALVCVILVHALIGVKLTMDTLSAQKKAGTAYYGANKKFWAVRVSGMAIFVLIFFHVILFIGRNRGAFRLNNFGIAQLILQLLMVAAIAIHVICNVKPQLISFGIKSLKDYALDIILILSGVLVFAGLAFTIYFFRWSAI